MAELAAAAPSARLFLGAEGPAAVGEGALSPAGDPAASALRDAGSIRGRDGFDVDSGVAIDPAGQGGVATLHLDGGPMAEGGLPLSELPQKTGRARPRTRAAGPEGRLL